MRKFLIGGITVLSLSFFFYNQATKERGRVPCDTTPRTYQFSYEAKGFWNFAGTGGKDSNLEHAENNMVGTWTRVCSVQANGLLRVDHSFVLKDRSGTEQSYAILEIINTKDFAHKVKASIDIDKLKFHGIRDFLAKVQFHGDLDQSAWTGTEFDSTGLYSAKYSKLDGSDGKSLFRKESFQSLSDRNQNGMETVYAPESRFGFTLAKDGHFIRIKGSMIVLQQVGSETISESNINIDVQETDQKLTGAAKGFMPDNVPLIEDDFKGTESYKRIDRESNLKKLNGANWAQLKLELDALTKDSANETFLRLRAYFSLYPERASDALDVLSVGHAENLSFRTLLDSMLQINDPKIEAVLSEALKGRENDAAEAKYMLQSFGLKEAAGENFIGSIAAQRRNQNPHLVKAARLSLGNISQTTGDTYQSQTAAYLSEEIGEISKADTPAATADNLHVISNYGGERTFEIIKPYLYSKNDFLLENAVTCLRFVPHQEAIAELMRLIKDKGVSARIRHLAIEEIGFHPLGYPELDYLGQYALQERSEAVVGSLISVLAKYYGKSPLVRRIFEGILAGNLSKDVKQQIELIASRQV